ncbi:MAG TPA: DEAD/DEAH box helicase [Gammaproteobacteria bacterium]|nr:DEAD/DEAH box helicase [Gammaproteobacteria bacterium]
MSSTPTTFQAMGLAAPILKAVEDAGYEQPSAIQAESIPLLLEGRDLLGQAQTGTGKTAAFALPLLSRIDVKRAAVQLLVLAPTRELAIQVAEAFQSYAHHLKNFHVLPIYGGQSYTNQLRQLKRGVQVVVGTPGRVMDHIRRGTLDLSGLQALVLDEADEMLRMGFIDDVEWILEQTPKKRQIALFSATMPAVVRKVAERHLNNPVVVKIATKTTTVTTIRQRYWAVSGLHKLDALTRILESEDFDGMIVFVRTKTATVELADKLAARGYASTALNGDIPQNNRERIIQRLKKGQLDILVATDVVARGLDVERISHVINYDVPHDTESYVHRIGRTGRAGRKGDAILFVAPRERRMLSAIERATRQSIEAMQMPTASDINVQRIERFKQRISETLDNQNLDIFNQIVGEYQHEHDSDPLTIAAALAHMAQGKEPLLLSDKPQRRERPPRIVAEGRDGRQGRAERPQRPPRTSSATPSNTPRPLKEHPDVEMSRFRLAVGYSHDVKPGNIVGAIANEAGIDSQYIGHIEIFEDFTTIDLPADMPKDIFMALKKTWVCGQKLDINRLGEEKKPAKPRKPKGKTEKARGKKKPGRRKAVAARKAKG